MTQREPASLARVLRALQAVLPSGTTVQHAGGDGPVAHLTVNGHRLRACWLGEGRPSRVEEALALAGSARPHVLVARAMSPGAQAAVRRAGLGWVDEAGGAEIVLDWLIVARSPRPAPPATGPPSGWTPAAAGVAEAILSGARPTVDAIRQKTGLSQSYCARALAFFAREGYLVSSAARGRRAGRRLAEPERLLHTYAMAAGAFRGAELRVAVLWRDPVQGLADLGRTWTAGGLRWAATGAVAAAVLAPSLTDVGTADVFVEGRTLADLQAAADRIRARPMEGGRLLLRAFPSAATANLTATQDGLCVAPWPRVYADLLTTGVRGEDAAEHLREVMGARG